MSEVSLLSAALNEDVEILSFDAPEDIERKLATMSLIVGSTIRLIQKHKNGSVIVAKGNIRLALCADIASKIIIKSEHK
jgi:Fe2+ transport system protein FeoA